MQVVDAGRLDGPVDAGRHEAAFCEVAALQGFGYGRAENRGSWALLLGKIFEFVEDEGFGAAAPERAFVQLLARCFLAFGVGV